MDDGLKHLRAQAMARHRAATRKVRRNENKGVKLSNTKHDVRRDDALTKIAKYNKPQLQAYIAKLDAFVSRSTQFHADMKGRPLPAKDYRKLKAAERKFNNQKLSKAAAVGGLALPPVVANDGRVLAEPTVKERRENLPRRRGSNPAVNNPWEPKNFQPWQINGEGALSRLEKMLRDRATPEGQLKEYKSQLKAATKMLREVGAKDLVKRVRDMDMDKFYILFNHSGFVEELSTDYEIVRSKDPHIEADFNGAREAAHRNAGRLIGWAEKQRLGS